MTAGSCSVAISRSRPRNAGTSGHQSRTPVHQCGPAPGARTAVRLCALRTGGQQRRQGRGLRRHASVRDHAGAPASARGQPAMANQQVRLRPRRHRRETLQQLQRLEHRLARAVVPRLLQPEHDAPVTPQALLCEWTRPRNAATLRSHLRRSALATGTKWARSGSSDDFRDLQLPGRNGGQGGD
jgi:hypothetical protein